METSQGGADTELRALDPRVRGLWWTTGVIRTAVLTALALVPDLVVDLPGPRGALATAVLLAVGVPAALLPPVRYRRWRYALRAEDLWIREGVWRVTTSVIPHARLQFVDTTQGPLERLFGLSALVVHTAAVGTAGRLPGLDAATAQDLRERLAGSSAARDGGSGPPGSSAARDGHPDSGSSAARDGADDARVRPDDDAPV